MGINISASLKTIIKDNFEYAFTTISHDLDRWSKLPNSLRARISIIKMNVQPCINFISSMLPIPPPPQFWNKLQRSVAKFIWNGKRPRLKLPTLQRQQPHGALSIPNFKIYIQAFTLRPLTHWFRPRPEVAWHHVEENLVAPYKLQEVIYQGERKRGKQNRSIQARGLYRSSFSVKQEMKILHSSCIAVQFREIATDRMMQEYENILRTFANYRNLPELHFGCTWCSFCCFLTFLTSFITTLF